MHQSQIISKKEHDAKTIFPELVDILIEHKADVLFNRQLRIHRENKTYLNTLNKSNKIMGNAFIMLWVKDLKLQLTQKKLEAIFELALENFFLQINAENLNQVWLSNYFINLKRIAKNFV